MACHVWVNAACLERGHARRMVDGIELTVEVSPYSVPKAVVGTYDQKKGLFTIEFRYIDNEPANPKPRDIKGVVIREGRFSHKILSISIPIDDKSHQKVGIISLRTKIANALRERVRDIADPDSPDVPDILNQEVAEEILDESLGELAGEFV